MRLGQPGSVRLSIILENMPRALWTYIYVALGDFS